MLIWLIIGAILVISLGYLVFYLQSVSVAHVDDLPDFSSIRQQEISEELEAGRLSNEEAKQLQQDLKNEVALTQDHTRKFWIGERYTLSYQLLLILMAVSVLGSLALYQYLGFNRDFAFSQKIEAGRVTQEDVTSFLSYRTQKYGRLQDWYWLGKGKLEQGDFTGARDAFAAALSIPIDNQEEALTLWVEYAQSIFFANGQRVNEELIDVVNQVLIMEPDQPTVLGLQGIIEFERQNYEQAILAWQRSIRSGASIAERASLLEGIHRAREAGGISIGQVPSIISDKVTLKLTVEGIEKLPADAIFLVYARVTEQPMPVAIKRVLPSQVNNLIELTNLDNLMPGKSLSETPVVDVVVKLARQSDQDLTQGREVSVARSIVVNDGKTVNLIVKL